MKKRNLVYLLTTFLFLSSCTFYQVYEVKPTNKSVTNVDNLLFEDDNCVISYDFWGNEGQIHFTFYNKTDANIYVKLNESNLIKNGYAYDYYKNRTFTNSSSETKSKSYALSRSLAVTGINVYNNIQSDQAKILGSASKSYSAGYAVSIKEDSVVRIPAKTRKSVTEYFINNILYYNCDMDKYPKNGRTNETTAFSAELSPITFSNLITYDCKGEKTTVKNEFYISKITNLSSSGFFEKRNTDKYCGDGSRKIKYFKFRNRNKFYVKYGYTDMWNYLPIQEKVISTPEIKTNFDINYFLKKGYVNYKNVLNLSEGTEIIFKFGSDFYSGKIESFKQERGFCNVTNLKKFNTSTKSFNKTERDMFKCLNSYIVAYKRD